MTVTIALSTETKQRIEAIAARTGRTKDAQLRVLVEAGLDELEEYFIAIVVRDSVRAGNEPVIGLDSLERELGVAS